MVKPLNQSGSHVVAVFVGVLVVAVIGLAGYKVWQTNTDKTVDTTQSSGSTKAPSSINSQADLTQAAKALDDSSSQVDSNLNDNGLNSDLNDLL